MRDRTAAGWRLGVALSAGAVLASACVDAAVEAGSGSWRGSVVDSAGVRLVTNPPDGLWAGEPRWRLVEELRIGGAGASDAATFGAVSAIDVGPNGRIFVADPQASEVRIFDAEGRSLGTLGGPGAGPGEIGGEIPALFAEAGGVRVVDGGNLRLTRFDPEGGAPPATTPIDVSRGIPLRWDRLPDGRIVVQLRSAGRGIGADLAGRDEVRLLGDSAALFTLPRGGSLVMDEGPGPPRFRLFEAEPAWDLGATGRFVSGMDDAYRLEVRAPGGALLQVTGRPHTPRRLEASDRALLRNAFAGFLEDQGIPDAAIRQFVEGVVFGDVYPAFARILMAPDDAIWVQRMRRVEELDEGGSFDPGDLGSDRWDIFDPAGRYLGVLHVPTRFRPLHFAGDAVYGVQPDDLGIPAVVRLRLVRE